MVEQMEPTPPIFKMANVEEKGEVIAGMMKGSYEFILA